MTTATASKTGYVHQGIHNAALDLQAMGFTRIGSGMFNDRGVSIADFILETPDTDATATVTASGCVFIGGQPCYQGLR